MAQVDLSKLSDAELRYYGVDPAKPGAESLAFVAVYEQKVHEVFQTEGSMLVKAQEQLTQERIDLASAQLWNKLQDHSKEVQMNLNNQVSYGLAWSRQHDPLSVPMVGDEPKHVAYAVAEKCYVVEFESGDVYHYWPEDQRWKHELEDKEGIDGTPRPELIKKLRLTLQEAAIIQSECEIPEPDTSRNQANATAMVMKSMIQAQAAALARKLVPWLGTGKAQRKVFDSDLTGNKVSIARLVVMTADDFKLITDLAERLDLLQSGTVRDDEVTFEPRANVG